MGITDYEILNAEKFGSRDYDITPIGVCEKCGDVIMGDNDEACRDRMGNLFCTRECFDDYYGFRRVAV